MERKNRWKDYNETQLQDLNKIVERYKTCLSQAKTERETIRLSIQMAEENGWIF
ncbi:hypothetical protein [Hespellia stercorisuis]|uniref:Uncharacterized protein n=1 Tax=Hespellia stercorisuis DSM 15480 TaxID=1121950 RepID=A0A1M6JM72_9FIRM|nr:hypothetical protein [Hespellia stercorisuis]SHJ47797.1 hypothetical protein SAMN02745243_00696 [Hespellia stercorisuis DSM 15480]